ncbi:MAG: CBS domain-containing protein [Syntrophobacterales bacterium]|nr:CBS domain-containing protein [Syntrophobacterales bacterium]
MVKPETTMNEYVSLMTEKRIRHLPVLNKGKLSGLASIGDVVKAIINEQEIGIEYLNNYIMDKLSG